MSYFKENPQALLDAIPTPRGDEEKALKDFKHNGMTSKNLMPFKFNDTSSSGFGGGNKNKNQLSTFGNAYDTPLRRLQSPKLTSSLMSSRR